MKTCSIDECEKGVRARGWCDMHYRRWRRHGDTATLTYRDPEESFTARVAWDGEHLIWTGAINRGGYGRLRVHGRAVLAHRYSWERINGPIPDDMVIDHMCWTPACVLPAHLRLATLQQNAQNLSGAMPGRVYDLPRGVYRYRNGYVAQARVNGRSRHFGSFSTVEDAEFAAKNARAIHFGEYAGNN